MAFSLQSYKKAELKSGILKKDETSVEKDLQVRFSEEKLVQFNVQEPSTIKLPSIHQKSYEALCAENEELLATQKLEKERITQLEAENTKLLSDYEGLCYENRILRAKLNSGDDENDRSYLEAYKSVYEDRQNLLGAEAAYKKRIALLEQENKQLSQSHNAIYTENKVLRGKLKIFEDKFSSTKKFKRRKKLRKSFEESEQSEREKNTVEGAAIADYIYPAVIYDEPYERVYLDRKVLRDAEMGYKKLINKLENELAQTKDELEKTKSELLSKIRFNKWAEFRNIEVKNSRLHVEVENLRQENTNLKMRLLKLKRKNPGLSRSNTFASASEYEYSANKKPQSLKYTKVKKK